MFLLGISRNPLLGFLLSHREGYSTGRLTYPVNQCWLEKICSFPYRHIQTPAVWRHFRPSKYIIPKKTLGYIWMSRIFWSGPFSWGRCLFFWGGYNLTFVFSPFGSQISPEPPRLRLLRLVAGHTCQPTQNERETSTPKPNASHKSLTPTVFLEEIRRS